jgi:hypothetical protein
LVREGRYQADLEPLGATVLWGEGGQYKDMFSGLCGAPGGTSNNFGPTFCVAGIPSGQCDSNGQNLSQLAFITGSEVNRWGLGIMQEIDSAAMRVWANRQHLELNVDAVSACHLFTPDEFCAQPFGKKLKSSFEDLDMFMVGGVIFF